METIITDDVDMAATLLLRGELVAFPTETVYGLGADATNESAVRRIFDVKGRPPDNPIIVHVASRDWLGRIASEVPPYAERLMDAFFPGPLTLILKRHPDVPAVVSAGLSSVGVRMPAHVGALAFITAAGTPVAAPSANVSGRPSPTSWQSVREDLDGRIACILQGARARVGLESTVVDCTRAVPEILRKGGLSLEQIRSVVAETVPYSEHSESGAKSPGVRHRHYAPRADVVPVDGPDDVADPDGAAFIGLSPYPRPDLLVNCVQPEDVDAYAHLLFEFLRECDRLGAHTIYCERVSSDGVGAALLDRIERAARR